VPKLGLNRLTLDDMNELDPEQALVAAVLRMAWQRPRELGRKGPRRR
jgi:hypothetical protein